MILLPKNTEIYEKAEKAIDYRLKSEGKTFESVLIDTLYVYLNNPQSQISENEALELYEAIENIRHRTPQGEKIVAKFKDEYISKYVAEQRELELQATKYEEIN